MGIADAELGSVAVELFDFVLKLCEDFCDALAGCIIDDRHKFIAAVSSYEMLRGNRVSQQPGKVQNQLVADGVAEAVLTRFRLFMSKTIQAVGVLMNSTLWNSSSHLLLFGSPV